MKDLKEMLGEQLINEVRRPVIYEIQGDESKGAAYGTFEVETAKKKYRHGFIQIDSDCIYMVSFNDVDDIKDLLNIDNDQPYVTIAYAMKPLEHKVIDGTIIVKLW